MAAGLGEPGLRAGAGRLGQGLARPGHGEVAAVRHREGEAVVARHFEVEAQCQHGRPLGPGGEVEVAVRPRSRPRRPRGSRGP